MVRRSGLEARTLRIPLPLLNPCLNLFPSGGGVEIAVGDRIKVMNTLESRLELATSEVRPTAAQPSAVLLACLFDPPSLSL